MRNDECHESTRGSKWLKELLPLVSGHGSTESAPISVGLPSTLCALREHRNNVCPAPICGSTAASEMIESTCVCNWVMIGQVSAEGHCVSRWVWGWLYGV